MATIVGVLVFSDPTFATAADAQNGSQTVTAVRADQSTAMYRHRIVERRASRVARSSTPTVLRGTPPATTTIVQPRIPLVMQAAGPGVALGYGYGSTVNPAVMPEGGWGGLDFSGLNPSAGGVITR
jgi:hypothetical protein